MEMAFFVNNALILMKAQSGLLRWLVPTACVNRYGDLKLWSGRAVEFDIGLAWIKLRGTVGP